MKLLPVSTRRIQRNDASDTIGSDSVAVDVIPTIRQVVYHEPSLFMVRAKQGERNSKGAEKERNRRNVRRGLFQELSRYYLCLSGSWTRAKLLSKGKHRRTQYVGDFPLTHPLISCAGFRDSPYSPRDSGRLGP